MPRVSRRDVLRAVGVTMMLPARGRAAERGTLDELLARRRMVRRFTSQPVSTATVRQLVATAMRAPSAGHTQPAAFVVVRDAKTRKLLGEAAFGQTFVGAAPVVLVACADVSRVRPRYGERAEQYAVIDGAFASLYLLFAVVEAGLGACFVGAFDDARVAELVGLPAHVKPIAVIPVGHPAEQPRPMRLRPLDDALRRERW